VNSRRPSNNCHPRREKEGRANRSQFSPTAAWRPWKR
jgi:hypothetical protein